MFVFKPCENLLLLPPKIFTTTVTKSKPHHLHLHHHHHHDVKLHCSPLKPHFKSITLSSSSPLSSPPPQTSDSLPPAADSSSSSLTVDFFMDSGGLSYVQAIQVIQKLPSLLINGDRRRPRSVIAYLESIGFSKTHISKLISKRPRLLFADVEKTLKPKIQLFQLDYGIPDSDIADLIASNPSILHRCVKTHLKPALDFFKSFVKTNEDLIKALKRNVYLLRSTYRRNTIEPNIDVLRQHGVPDSEIVHLILTRLTTLMLTPKVFKSIVERIVNLGFKPETRVFTTAVSVMCQMKKATWDSKIDLLKGGLGWSDEQILDTFRRHPRFLTVSGEKMKERIEFFKESMNWDASFLSQYPILINYSLKIRVIPRLAVLKCLMSKEIIKEDKQFIAMLKLNETEFLSKYVFKYQEQLPYLYYEVYKKECMLGCEKDNGLIFNQQDHGDVDVTV